jgi:hypothetical protein
MTHLPHSRAHRALIDAHDRAHLLTLTRSPPFRGERVSAEGRSGREQRIPTDSNETTRTSTGSSTPTTSSNSTRPRRGWGTTATSQALRVKGGTRRTIAWVFPLISRGEQR